MAGKTLSCGAKVAKYILFFTTFIFWFTGALLLVLGTWILAEPDATQYLQIASFDYSLVKSAAITACVVGGFIFVIGGLGCFGACAESSVCLTAFATLIVLLLIPQVIAVILTAVLHSQIMSELGSEMSKTMQDDYGRSEIETTAWNFLQIEMKCCGVYGTRDWIDTFWWRNNRASLMATVPQTCCVELEKPINFTNPTAKNPTACYLAAYSPQSGANAQYVYKEGCLESLNDWMTGKTVILIGLTAGAILVQIIVVILACVLKGRIKDDHYQYLYI
jgi:hypothetical protein